MTKTLISSQTTVTKNQSWCPHCLLRLVQIVFNIVIYCSAKFRSPLTTYGSGKRQMY